MLLQGTLVSRFAAVGRLATIVGVLVACSALYAQKPEQILNRLPTQADVDCDVPAAADVEKCVVKRFKEQDVTGVVLCAPDGSTPLRVWTVAPGSSKVEQIRFYKNGIEVFRDVIGQEARWFNTGGTRRGVLGADKKTIESWTAISPQEATQEAVAAGAHAGNIVREAAKVCGGGGGGKPGMAQAGGKDASKAEEALKAAKAVIEAQLS